MEFLSSASLEDYIYTIIPTTLTCLACTWVVINYFSLSKKNIGLSMVLVLSISDFGFAATFLTSVFYPKVLNYSEYYIFFFDSMYFSIFWASGMALLVYCSLKIKSFQPFKFFVACLAVIILISFTFTYM